MSRVGPADSLRRRLLRLSLAGLIAPAARADAQRSQTPRLGVLWQTTPPPPLHPHITALLAQLEQLGWHDGRNLDVVFRYGGDDAAQLAKAAGDLVRMNVAVIATAGDLSTRAALQATSTIPIVALVGHPVESGFAKSLSRPGTNVTGFAVIADDLAVKRLQLLKELVPRLERVAALWDPATNARQAKAAEAAARSLGLHVDIVRAGAADSLQAAFAVAARGGAQAVLVLISPALIGRRTEVAQAAARHRLPAMYHSPVFTEVGGLIAYGPSLDEQWRHLAATIDRILKGAHAGELPFQQPSRFELDVNKAAARELGLVIPDSILLRASRVID